jgi:hypothetical protein
MYRPILKYIETTLDLIDPEIGDDALDIELYQAYHKVQVEMKLEGQTLIQNNNTSHDLAEYEAGFKAYFEKVSDINKSDLARFVCHRKALLQFLQKQLSLNKDGKYQLEKSIHQIIFPMGSTSADVPIDDHNLWVLDEKLAYHTFLASDKPLNTNPHVEIKSSSEPDLLVFDKACAFAPAAEPPFPAVVIIEFKRPMRNDYNDKDNPVKQVLDYVSEIRSGKAKTPTGRPVFTGKDTPFFCYVVADMTQSLVDQVKLLDLIEMPDGQGYFGFRKQFNAYVEVVTYSKIISDAQKRNASFFRTLGLPDRI